MPMPDCNRCSLRKGAKQVVWGSGPADAKVMLIGEAPGKMEDKIGRPFVGPAGQELDHYLERAGLRREDCYVDNLVKCRPPNDRNPKPEEIAECSPHLRNTLQAAMLTTPPVIGTLGAFSTRWFLGEDADLERMHGIPQVARVGSCEVTVVPIYHPAYGLHETGMMARIAQDFEALASVVKGKLEIWGVQDAIPAPRYKLLTDVPVMDSALLSSDLVAVDTETGEGDEPWCLSATSIPGHGFVVRASDEVSLGALAKYLAHPAVTTVLHNALFDLPVLAKMGVKPAKVADTMVAAYLLQDQAQGLKPLAYRLAGMEMQSYREVVAEATKNKAIEYLNEIVELEWPPPAPLLEWVKGKPHVKQPQPIEKKVTRILKDVAEKGADPWERWHHIKPEEGRGMVEERLGPMLLGYLSDIDLDVAVRYSAQDADATIRIWPVLWKRIQEEELESAFWLDMGIIQMVVDMMTKGMLVDRAHFEMLAEVYGQELDDLQRQISAHIGGEYINPGSTQQVGELLFKRLGMKPGRRTKGGEGLSTDAEILEGLRNEHPVVPLILDWRGRDKLLSTYIRPIPQLLDGADRVHTTIRTTRTATGRLSSANPNQQNIPTRTEEGKRVRDGFVAREGCSLLSLDFAQVEFRVEAHESQDENLRGVFLRGDDIHNFTACRVFDIAEHEVDEMKHRYPCKRVGFGVLYGISAPRLLMLLEQYGCEGWDLGRCEDLIDEWFILYPGVKRHMSAIYAQARRYGKVRDLIGRYRLTPEVRSAIPKIVEAGLRQAGNMPAQGGAQEIIKTAMRDLTPVYKQVQVEGYVCDPLIQIHDDILWEVTDEIMGMVVPLFKSVLESAVKLSVPVLVDAKAGKRWGSMTK